MQITYRGTGGLVTLLVLAVIGVAGAVLLVTVAAALTIVAVAGGAGLLLARALGWTPWRRPSSAPPDTFAGDTIEGTVIASESAIGQSAPTAASAERPARIPGTRSPER
jgi:hypothetical protein